MLKVSFPDLENITFSIFVLSLQNSEQLEKEFSIPILIYFFGFGESPAELKALAISELGFTQTQYFYILLRVYIL